MAYNKYEFKEVLTFCKLCPHLVQLWAVSQSLNDGVNSLELTDSTNLLKADAESYADGKTKIVFDPVYPYHSTYYLSLFRILYSDDTEYNTDILEKMDEVCKWFFEAQENGTVPELSDEKCIKLELLTPRAIRRMAYEDESGRTVQDYYIAFRIHKVNPSKKDAFIV